MSIVDELNNEKFSFKKKYGQNFIFDTNLLRAIVSDAGVIDKDTVIEIGTGAGTLTECIAEKVKKVVTFEIDRELEGYLKNKFLNTNVQICIGDIMKIKEEEIIKLIQNSNYHLIANLPYYITTPIIMKFLEMKNPPKSITIMVQKEVADRIVSNPKNGDYGAISVGIALYGDARITRIVNRNLFVPSPNVDSAVLKIVYKKRDLSDVEINKVKKIIRAGFANRRKTFINNISTLGYNKTYIKNILINNGYNENIRAEELSVDDYIKISRILNDKTEMSNL